MKPDKNAIDKALTSGSDLRTVPLSDGTRVRLLTYRIAGQPGLDLIQLGKPIEDQMRILGQVLSGLIIIGGAVIILLGFGSWWQAGRLLTSTQQAWNNQQMFIANASHELRAPLTLIRAASDAALRKTRKKQPAVDNLLNDILSESDHMNHLVEDLLLLSRLDVGQLKFSHEPINLKEFAEDLQRHFQPLCEQHRIDFSLDVRNVIISGDRTRLHQVMLIVLDNALRHTDQGGRINLEIGSSKRYASISVTDSGEGIPPEHLAHVFDRFYQVKSDRRENTSGSGLGLSIAKSIVEAHGGSIGIQSEAGKCTAVRILLPKDKRS
jgi:signal transduction histidine kinase